MLILQRKIGESVYIGDDIQVSILSVEEGRVRLAIDAPKSVPILRNELRNAMDANRDAANEQSQPLELLDLLEAVREAGHKPEQK